MHKHYTVHFTKGALPLQNPTEHYLLDPELGRQKGCCHQWCRDPAALQAHGPCRLPLPVHWRLAHHSNQGGVSSCRRGPQPPVLRQQPQLPPPGCLWQRLCFIHGAREGLPAIAAAPMQPASAPQLPPEPTTSRTMAPTMASGGPALPSGVSTLLESSRPTGTQPLTTLEFLSPFTSYSAGAHPAILGALSLPPRLPSGPLTPRPASWPLTLVPVLEGTSPCRWASGQPPLLHPTGSKASRAACPRCFCLAVSLALLSLFLALPLRAQQGTEDFGQRVTSSGFLASSGVGETGQVCSRNILTEDDVYCSCLAKTLCHVPVPVTVGFYAHFGCRLHMMLDKITALMEQEAAQREAEELQRVQWQPRSVRGWGLLQLLWYLVFLQPIITELHLRRKNVKFLFIRFSAWQYAGTDKLWAGLVTTLCEGIRHQYGALPFSVYSVLSNRPTTTPDCCQSEWHCRRRVCVALLALMGALCLGVCLLYLSMGGHVLGRSSVNDSLLRAFGGAATTLSGSGMLMAMYSVGKHLFVSQRKKIERLVSREKFGSQLGFMCQVKKEVELLTDFLCFLEIYQRCRLRVVLEVTGLDTCCPERVVGVLNAINTLLSDSHAPFIFILVVDPSILVSCLESAGSMKGTADNGYLFLNRTVTLPFSVPMMGRRTKLQFLHDAVQSRDDLLYREMTRKLRRAGGNAGSSEGVELLSVDTQAGNERAQGRLDAEAARLIREALFCLYDERDCLYEYVPDNMVSMRRIVNTVPITVRLLQQQERNFGGPTPRQAVAWVVLANQWPCRLSWVLQCLEDREQSGGPPEARALLWDVFCANSHELHTMTKALQNVLALDGDPELFERFLGTDFPFTVTEAQKLLRCTVNLDHSIRRRMGLIRAVSALKTHSPPKSPEGDTHHASHGGNHEPRTSGSGHPAGHAPTKGSEALHPRGCAHCVKPRPVV